MTVFVTDEQEQQQQEEELGILGVGCWEIEKTQDFAGQWSPLIFNVQVSGFSLLRKSKTIM